MLVNNAGSNVPQAVDKITDDDWDRIVELNLTSCMALSRAVIPQMKERQWGRIIHISSIMGLASKAGRDSYSATKAALHSYTLSLRYKLKGTPVKVLEIAPPWVQTDLLGSNNEPRAMPLAEFIDETTRVLGTDVEEVLVELAKPLRNNAGPNEAAFVNQFNDMMVNPR